MHIISKLSLVFGNSHEFGKKRQLVSNSCSRIETDSIQYDGDDFNEKEDSISSDDDYEDDRTDFNSQTQLYVTVAGAKVLNRKGKELQNLDPENKNTIISDTRVRKRPADASLTKQQGPKSTSQPGSTITVSQRLTGCRIQCDRAHPTPLSFSAQLPILVLEFKWNCLLGNTINTLAALGHLGHIRNSGVVSDLLQAFVSSNILPNISIDSVNYSLKKHGYSTAITKKGNQFDLISIEQYATSHQYPMLVLLNMTNVLYQSRKHLIGIVPLSQGDEVHMHIVEGSHPENKTIPLNQTNLGWCSGDSSCFVDRVVVFLPGKKLLKRYKRE
jgi:hypothetical protein